MALLLYGFRTSNVILKVSEEQRWLFFQHFLLLSFVLQILPNEFKYLHFSSIIIIDFLLLISNPRDTVYYPNVHLFYIYFHETQMSISSVFGWFLIIFVQQLSTHLLFNFSPKVSSLFFGSSASIMLSLYHEPTNSVQHLLKPFSATSSQAYWRLHVVSKYRGQISRDSGRRGHQIIYINTIEGSTSRLICCGDGVITLKDFTTANYHCQLPSILILDGRLLIG